MRAERSKSASSGTAVEAIAFSRMSDMSSSEYPGKLTAGPCLKLNGPLISRCFRGFRFSFRFSRQFPTFEKIWKHDMEIELGRGINE